MKKGFTLIELLIVVAIIAILAAIAMPNFLEAQTRSKVARIKSDIRSIKVALESYFLDYNSYPASYAQSILRPEGRTELQSDPNLLSTPIAYITRVPRDVFHKGKDLATGGDFGQFELMGVNSGAYAASPSGNRPYIKFPRDAMLVWSVGPDELTQTGGYHTVESILFWENKSNVENHDPKDRALLMPIRYDPTNGTVTAGDIYLYSTGQFSF